VPTAADLGAAGPAFAAPDAARAAWGALAALAFALAAWRAGSLAASGAVAALAVGTAAVFGGWRWGALLVAFFVLASALSRWRRAAKQARTGRVVDKGGRRDAAQVLANGGVFAALAAAGSVAALGGAAGRRSPAPRPARSPPRGRHLGTEVGTAVGGHAAHVRGWRPVPPGPRARSRRPAVSALVAGARSTGGTALLFGLPPSAAAGALPAGWPAPWADTSPGPRAGAPALRPCGEDTEQRVTSAAPRRDARRLPGSATTP
jgi:hypothetical protein